MAARLSEKYRNDVVPLLMQELGYANVNQVPRLEKVVLNMGLGEAIQNAKIMDSAVVEMTAISGQKPVVTKARKAIANFKLRENMPIGCMVTLRGTRMYEFLDRLMSLALPRVRDFRGVSDRAFDGRGNYSLGVREQIIFPEIDLDKVDKVRGLTVSIVTTANTDAEGKALLRALGMPFRA
jgi:large subunit ribosomal protein L5